MRSLAFSIAATAFLGFAVTACQPADDDSGEPSGSADNDSEEDAGSDRPNDDTSDDDASDDDASDDDAGTAGDDETDAGLSESDAGLSVTDDAGTAGDDAGQEASDDADGGTDSDAGALGAPQGDERCVAVEGTDVTVANATVEWEDSFEGAFGDWSVEGGLWAVGEPDFEAGPAPLSGTRLAGTNLVGNYPANQDARLVSPEFAIEPGDDNPRFKLALWHHLANDDHGMIEISVDGGEWEALDHAQLKGRTGGWGQRVVLLRDYEGHRVRIGVRLVTNDSTFANSAAPGIYVDDAAFETGEMDFETPDTLDDSLGNWSVEGGGWGRGVPSASNGPQPLSGEMVFGTNLDGNYAPNQDSRLVSPEFLVADAEDNLHFKFGLWHDLANDDYGMIEISADGAEWQPLDHAEIKGRTGGWGQRVVPLRDYDGQRVRIGVRLVTNDSTFADSAAAGIYMDSASLQRGEMQFQCPDTLEDGLGSWSVEGGGWGRGASTAEGGPSALSGDLVFGTNLDGTYAPNQDSRLVSPEFWIEDAQDNPRFKFAFWHDLANDDSGMIEISVDGGAWEALDHARMKGRTGGWGQRVVLLRDYEGHRVRIGVRLVTNDSNFASSLAHGIFVDSASFQTGEMSFDNPDDLEAGLGNWSVEGGGWGWGAPTFAAGPEPSSGEFVFGTNLDGNYAPNQDSRLVSPEFWIDPADANPRFRFGFWQAIAADDSASLELSIDGGAWEPLDGMTLSGNGGSWSPSTVQLRDYANHRVRVGIRLSTNDSTFASSMGPGLYVDDASFARD